MKPANGMMASIEVRKIAVWFSGVRNSRANAAVNAHARRAATPNR
jgi:hypothetical protein